MKFIDLKPKTLYAVRIISTAIVLDASTMYEFHRDIDETVALTPTPSRSFRTDVIGVLTLAGQPAALKDVLEHANYDTLVHSLTSGRFMDQEELLIDLFGDVLGNRVSVLCENPRDIKETLAAREERQEAERRKDEERQAKLEAEHSKHAALMERLNARLAARGLPGGFLRSNGNVEIDLATFRALVILAE